MIEPRAPAVPPQNVPRWVRTPVFSVVIFIAAMIEVTRWADAEDRAAALTGWMAGPTQDWFPFLPLLVLILLAMAVRKAPKSGVRVSRWRKWLAYSAADGKGTTGSWIASLGIGVLAFLVSAGFNAPYRDLQPAYHDEFSYLFQAETFLQGRLWFPSAPEHPELFDQMHVLNEGHFASRYFPGTGLWLTPFLAMGIPWLAQLIAQSICAMLMFWTGRELTSNGVGLLAGILFALSPGMILFSGLMLAHHPTLLGLMFFLWAFVKWIRTGSLSLLVIAGTGLAFAMLCRPMTAAGFAFPFGLFFVFWWITGRPRSLPPQSTENISETQEISRIVDRYFAAEAAERTHVVPAFQRSLAAVMLGLPLVVAALFLLATQREITGSAWVSPYQLYTDVYTPRHRYGFDNVIIGEKHLGPKVLDNYDRWAENLTPELARENVITRLTTSMRWTLGVLPLTLGAATVLLTPTLGSRRWFLIIASIISLHVAHIPYWFVGIMGWHYVLETAPLWLLIFAEGSARLERTWVQTGAVGMRIWWRAMIGIAVAVNLITVPPLWPGRLPQGLAETAYPRRLYTQFRHSIEGLRNGEPVIVFVIPDPTDRHMDFVTNPPSLDGPVLIARLSNRADLAQRASLFPDRHVLIFNAADRSWEQVRRAGQPIPESKTSGTGK